MHNLTRGHQPPQNTSATNKQTTVPYDINLRPNTTCAQFPYSHSLGRELPAKLEGALQRGVPGAQVPGVPGPGLRPEPVCGEQLHGDPAAGGAPPAAASEDHAELQFWFLGSPIFAVSHLAGKQSSSWLMGCSSSNIPALALMCPCPADPPGHRGPRRLLGCAAAGLPALQLHVLTIRCMDTDMSVLPHSVMWSTGYNIVRPDSPLRMRRSLEC